MLHAGRAAKDREHIKRDFSLKALVNPPRVGLGGEAPRGQNKTFSEYGHVAYQIKADDSCSKVVASILPQPRGWGQTISFSESM